MKLFYLLHTLIYLPHLYPGLETTYKPKPVLNNVHNFKGGVTPCGKKYRHWNFKEGGGGYIVYLVVGRNQLRSHRLKAFLKYEFYPRSLNHSYRVRDPDSYIH